MARDPNDTRGRIGANAHHRCAHLHHSLLLFVVRDFLDHLHRFPRATLCSINCNFTVYKQGARPRRGPARVEDDLQERQAAAASQGAFHTFLDYLSLHPPLVQCGDLVAALLPAATPLDVLGCHGMVPLGILYHLIFLLGHCKAHCPCKTGLIICKTTQQFSCASQDRTMVRCTHLPVCAGEGAGR